MQHAYWLLEKRKIVRVSTPALRGAGTQGPRRPRFPFFVLQCQRAGGSAAEATLPNPQWKQNRQWESTTAEVSAEKISVMPRFCPMDRAVAFSPAGWEPPAQKGYLGIGPLIVKGVEAV